MTPLTQNPNLHDLHAKLINHHHHRHPQPNFPNPLHKNLKQATTIGHSPEHGAKPPQNSLFQVLYKPSSLSSALSPLSWETIMSFLFLANRHRDPSIRNVAPFNISKYRSVKEISTLTPLSTTSMTSRERVCEYLKF